MPPHWTLSLLGRFRLAGPGGSEAGLTSKKTMGLLAILALAPGQALRREQAIALLWSDRGAEQARSSLRQTLVALRKELGEAPLPLVIDGEILRLDRAQAASDVLEFQRLADSSDLTDLRQAAALYQGELLDGIAIADDAFDGWLRAAREQLRDQAAQVLRRLAQAGAREERIEAARRLVALDPLAEPSHRILMEVHAAAGDTAAAIRQYESCCQVLKQELGISPSRDLVDYRASLAGSPAARRAVSEGRAEKPSVAVLPFDNLGGDPEQRYFSDAVSEDIINGLSRFSSLFVVARHSSFRFREQAGDVQAIAGQLGVRYLVTGSVRRAGERIRIAAQLIDSSDGRQVWSDRFERRMTDLFEVQDDVVQLILSCLAGHLENTEIRAAMAKPTENLAAYDCLLRGIEFLRGYGEGVNQKAIEMFERAVALDPNYGLAQAYLALALLVANEFDNAPVSIKERALALARLAVKLAPDDSRCHQYLGDAYVCMADYDMGIAQYERALALNPNDANVLTRFGFALAKAGRSQEGLLLSRQAVRNNPFCPDYYWSDLAIVAYCARQYEEALAAGRKLIGHQRYWQVARVAACLAQLGRDDEAREMAAIVLRLKPDFSLASETVVYADSADVEHVKDGMRKAGLPE